MVHFKKKKVPWLLKRQTKHELVKHTKFLQRWSRESTGGVGVGGDRRVSNTKSQIHTVPLNASPLYSSTRARVCWSFTMTFHYIFKRRPISTVKVGKKPPSCLSFTAEVEQACNKKRTGNRRTPTSDVTFPTAPHHGLNRDEITLTPSAEGGRLSRGQRGRPPHGRLIFFSGVCRCCKDSARY